MRNACERLADDAREKKRCVTFDVRDLRHTVGTLAVQIWRLTDVQGYMGPSNIQTMRYIHHKPEHDTGV